MSPGDSSSLVYLVTGATGAIGEAIARGLAEDPAAEVVLACRNEHKARATVDAIVERTGNRRVRYVVVDVALGASVEAFAAAWQGPLNVLVNNAATAPRMRQTTVEGLERTFATNVLGYFRMMRACTPLLAGNAPARVVNVASYWAGDLDLNDLQFERRVYDNDTAYRQSKQADRMLTVAFAERLRGTAAVNACHPGDVNSQLSRDLGFGGHELPEHGARTPIALSTGRLGPTTTGTYFEHEKPKPCRFAKDRTTIEALFAACDELA